MSYLDELYKKYGSSVPKPTESPIVPETPSMRPQFANPIQRGIQGVEQAGGGLLSKTLKGLSYFGQTILGTLEALENPSNYDQFYEPNEKGEVKFRWDKIDDFFDDVTAAGGAQGMRVWKSDSLSELSQNTISGVDILKKLPGSMGEFFRNDDTKGKEFGIGVAGLALEILTDPSSLVGGAVGKGVGSVAQAGAKAGVLGDRAGDVLGRLAGTVASGNVVAGPAAVGLREAAFASRGKLLKIANEKAGTRWGRVAENTLEWAMGPTALTTSGEMVKVLSKYAALKEDLPKEMLTVANTAATVTARLPIGHRSAAQRKFGELAAAGTAEAEESALQALEKLGVKRAEAATIGNKFREANLRLIDIMSEAKGVMPGFDVELSQYHLRRSYRMFVDPKLRMDWLDHLVKVNTPASFQIKETALRQQLLDGLGLGGTEEITERTVGRTVNDAAVFSGTQSVAQATAAQGKHLPTERIIGRPANDDFRGAYAMDDEGVRVFGQSTADYGKSTADDLTKYSAKHTEQANRLSIVINNLEDRIKYMESGGQRDKLVATRNKYQAQLDDLRQRSAPIAGVVGNEGTVAQNQFKDTFESRLARGRKDVMDTVNSSAAGADLADSAVVPKVPKVEGVTDRRVSGLNAANDPNGPFVDYYMENQFRQGLQSGKGMRLKDELLPEEKRFIPDISAAVKRQDRLDFLEDFTKYVGDDSFQRQAFVGFERVDGVPVAKFADKREAVRHKTLADIGEWAADWAEARGLKEDDKATLIASVKNSLAYVPGSQEFASAVRTKGQSLRDLEPDLARVVENELGVTNVNKSSIKDRTLDPIYHQLFGSIDAFSVNAAEQGVLVGDLAARTALFTEMRKRGLVLTADEIEKQGVQKQWFDKMGDIYKVEGDNTEYYIHRTNARSIQAIDRSLGETSNGVGKAVSHAANLFRRAALVTDPSAHATQFLGNIAMLQMMGYKDMFRNPVRFVREMNSSFKSIMLYDDTFKEAVDAGLQVTQTVLSEQGKNRLAQAMTTLPASMTNGDRQGAMSNLFRIAQDVMRTGTDGAYRGYVNAVTAPVRAAGVNGATVAQVGNNLLSPAAMFQVSDQMTRLYAYRDAVKKGTQDLMTANPILKGLTTDGGTKVNWEQVAAKAKQTMPEDRANDLIQTLQDAHKVIREEAAQIGNDVALNYSDVPLAINYLSKTGVVPFIKFQYKATGRIMKWMDETPWVFSPYIQAQRNFNDALNPDPDHFDQQRQNLSSTVRDSLVIPTGGKDEIGRQEFVDLGRWLPFGMYMRAANNGGGESGLSAEPSSLVSTPILDLINYGITKEGKQDGQSFSGYFAQKMAETLLPAGVAPGGRKIETLAKAIEQSYLYVDEHGNPVERKPSQIEQAIVEYSQLPERVGNAVFPEEGMSATGVPRPPSESRPRTTVDQSMRRFAVPGVGFSADAQKTATEFDKQYETRINSLKQKRGAIINNMQGQIASPEIAKQVQRIDTQIQQLEQLRMTKNRNLILGE